MALVTFAKAVGPTGFGRKSTAEDVTEGLSLTGKTILVTGCTSGLGAEACRVLALRGARVLGTARTQAAADKACAVLPTPGIGYACELAEPASVRACVERIKSDGHRLDAIICNAGIMALPKLKTAYGYELQFFTNHIGHFILVTGLLDALAEDGRVVMLSSMAHAQAPKGGIRFDNLKGERGYSAWGHYGQSKLANLLFAKELQRRFAGTQRSAYAVHPGVIHTNLARSMGWLVQVFLTLSGPFLLKTIPQGAATEVFAAVHPKALPLAGQYLADSNAGRPSKYANDAELAARLWTVSEQIARDLPA
jgi:NAD(P)-dependent dehydrogenase (short-subunit alcohol dehydrogenase family)